MLYSAIAVLALVSAALLLLDHAGVDFPVFDTVRRAFDVDVEVNVPTWFQVLVLAAVAAAALTAASLSRQAGLELRPWQLLAAAFAYLSLDEMVQLHEFLSPPLRERLGTGGGALHYAWILVAAPAVLVFAGVMLGFLRRLPRAVARLLVVAGAVYVGGAIGMELPGGYLDARYGRESVVFGLAAIVEESLEMLGMTTALLAISRYVRSLQTPVTAAA